MPEVQQLIFSYKEVVTALLKKENIHEGIWALYIEFGLAAVNAPMKLDDDPTEKLPKTKEVALDHLMPTAIIPIKKIGIQRAPELSSISVDAAVVNPKPRRGA